ncbi:hypothetical protein [Pseudocitrobacter faecalis]|uniref:hypothetical protein n=1 Tax=Pseudocitrobacter faecalis TaxID=1398493 RepID=UPI00331641F8
MGNNKSSKYTYYIICGICCIFAIYFTSRFSVKWIADPDAANSPIVWRAFLHEGFSAFKHWTPTFDNWYFTVYPLNFALFYILNDDGIAPIVISSAIFIILVSILSSKITLRFSGYIPATAALISITFISPDLYINGYYGHPFSHNSTNAYGFIALALYFSSLTGEKVFHAILIGVILLISSASDPWIQASFTIPILISEFYNAYINKERRPYAAILLIAFLLSITNSIQIFFNLPVHGFKITSLDQMLDNFERAVILTSKILPIWVEQNIILSYFSFVFWMFAFLFSAYTLFKKGGVYSIISLFFIMSILGIYSSSIIGDQLPHQRFYLNVAPVVLITLSICAHYKRILYIPIILTLGVSLYAYATTTLNYNTNKNIDEYITFLKKNDLSYGYGSFWGMNMTVNWLSKGALHITPVYFDKKTGFVDFKSVRVQTLATWHTKAFIESQPNRQFISISKGTSGDRCADIEICIAGIKKQIGQPDEILHHSGMTFLVYNIPIKTNI